MAGTEKKARAEGRTIVFVDEAGFYLLAAAVYTWAPRGQTPILKYPMWEHLSVISAITPTGKLYTWIKDHAFKGEDIVCFLKHLLRQIAGKLLIIWDGLPAHRGQTVKQMLSDGAAKRLHLECLPGYAPDLNPDEGVWGYLKTVELANVCCHDLDELRYELRKAIARLRPKSHLIQSFFHQAQLDPSV
jgi:transposase